MDYGCFSAREQVAPKFRKLRRHEEKRRRALGLVPPPSLTEKQERERARQQELDLLVIQQAREAHEYMN